MGRCSRGCYAAAGAALILWLGACTTAAQPPTAGFPAAPPPATAPATLSGKPVPEPTARAGETPDGSPSAVPTAPTLPPTAAPTPAPRPFYELEAELDYARKTVGVAQVIRYTNPLDQPLQELVLVVPPNQVPGVLVLNALRWGGGQPVERFSLEGIELRLPLEPSLDPGEELELELNYDLFLPERSGSFGYTELQVNLGDWYPFIPPILPETGWAVRLPWANGENLVYASSDFQVRLRVLGEGLVVAASAPAEPDGDWRSYRLDSARTFALSISPHYQVTELETPYGLVLGYGFPGHTAAGEAAAQAATQALELYSELFSPYQHPTLSVVEASFGDGMEYEGLIFVSQGFYDSYDGTPSNYLTLLSAHETAHQWWYGRVGNDQALEPWLDEALATFCELLYYERFHPQAVEWWWFLRVRVYSPQGWINQPIYEHSAFRPYVNAVYLRGVQFMNELRSLAGEESLLAFLKEYDARFAYRQATAKDFFSLLAEFTDADLEPLVEQYFLADS